MSQHRRTGGVTAAISITALAACLSVGLVACSTTVTGVQATSPQDSGARAAGGPGTPTATPDASPGAANGGSVTLLLGKSSYGPTDPIAVTIRNGRAVTIAATGQHTSCTPLALERTVNGAWQPQGYCLSLRPSQVLEIAPGASVTEQLLPSTDRGATQRWPTGIYRVTLEYAESDPAPGGPSAAAHSAQFAIG